MKYPLQALENQILSIPKGAKILYAVVQSEVVMIHILADKKQTQLEKREFTIVIDEHFIVDSKLIGFEFLNSITVGEYVWYVFYK